MSDQIPYKFYKPSELTIGKFATKLRIQRYGSLYAKDVEGSIISCIYPRYGFIHKSLFKNHIGYAPFVEEDKEREIMKAMEGKVFTVRNIPVEGLRLVGEGKVLTSDSRATLPPGNGVGWTYVVEDPRGFNHLLPGGWIHDQVIRHGCGISPDGKIDGEYICLCDPCYNIHLVNVMSVEDNTIEMMTTSEFETKYGLVKMLGDRKLEPGVVYTYLPNGDIFADPERILFLGKMECPPGVGQLTIYHRYILAMIEAENIHKIAVTGDVKKLMSPWNDHTPMSICQIKPGQPPLYETFYTVKMNLREFYFGRKLEKKGTPNVNLFLKPGGKVPDDLTTCVNRNDILGVSSDQSFAGKELLTTMRGKLERFETFFRSTYKWFCLGDGTPDNFIRQCEYLDSYATRTQVDGKLYINYWDYFENIPKESNPFTVFEDVP